MIQCPQFYLTHLWTPCRASWEEQGSGFQQCSRNRTTVAFADNLVPLSESWDGMWKKYQTLEVFCKLIGLKTQGEKCHGFYIQPTKDLYMINDCCSGAISGTPLSMIEHGSSEKYLGLYIDPWTGISKPELLEKVKGWVQRTGKAA